MVTSHVLASSEMCLVAESVLQGMLHGELGIPGRSCLCHGESCVGTLGVAWVCSPLHHFQLLDLEQGT